MELAYKTKGGAPPHGKPKVYYTGHPDDCPRFLDAIAAELFATQDCAIYYDVRPEAPSWDAGELRAMLDQMQLLVIPVTRRFLTEDSRALAVEFAYAMERHIPVLPLAQESGLETLFDQACGDLQMLDKTVQDDTAIRYEEKLKKFLSSVLIGDALAAKVRAAFDAYIFLSYRKKDRRYAQELMRLIHRNDFCRDIAIWYDEFLIPGEDFNDAIASALQKSSLFAMAVTPNLLEDPNYVMEKEYSAAVKAGKLILPVELAPTDQAGLKRKYDGIPDCTDAHDGPALSQALLDAVRRLAIQTGSSSTPEHDYFIGLAYLGGIDVEVDLERAVELIGGAADGGLPEAMAKLVEMYRNGVGVARSYPEALSWQEKLVEALQERYDAAPGRENGLALAGALEALGEAYFEQKDLVAAKAAYLRAQEMNREMSRLISPLEKAAFTGSLKESWHGVEGIFPLMRDMWGRIDSARQDLARTLGEETASSPMMVALKPALMANYKELQILWEVTLLTVGVLLDIIRGEWRVLRRFFAQFRAELAAAKGERGPLSLPGRLLRADVSAAKAARAEMKIQVKEVVRNAKERLTRIRGLAVELKGLITGKFSEVKQEISAVDRFGRESKELQEEARRKASAMKEVSRQEDRDMISRMIQARTQSVLSCARLGDLSRGQGRFDEAEAAYQKCLKHCKRLKGETDREVTGFLALRIGYEGLGDLRRDQGRAEEAEACYLKALNMAKQLQCRDSSFLSSTIAGYDDLGDAGLAAGRTDKAELYYMKGYIAARQLLKDAGDPAGISASCDRLGGLYEALGQMEAAEWSYKRALEADGQLVLEAETVEHEQSLAASLSRLGDFYAATGRPDSANECYMEAAALCGEVSRETGVRCDWRQPLDKRELVRREERTRLQDMPATLLSMSMKELWEYVDSFEEEPPERLPKDVERELIPVYQDMGKLCHEDQQFEVERMYLEKALALHERLGEDGGDEALNEQLSYCLDSLGALHAEAGRLEEAEGRYRQALELDRARHQAKASADNVKDLAFSCGRLADLYLDMGRLEEAKGFAQEQVEHYRQYCAAEKTAWGLERLAGSYDGLGDICDAAGASEEAQAAWREAFHLWEQICREGGSSAARRSLARHYAAGRGVAEDPERAAYWRRQAEERS